MSVSAEEVRRIAALARLSLEDARIPAIVEELNGILRHMAVLHDATDAAPTPQAEQTTVRAWRPDGVGASLSAESIAAIAPAMRDGFFLVPRLASHHGQGGAHEAVSS